MILNLLKLTHIQRKKTKKKLYTLRFFKIPYENKSFVSFFRKCINKIKKIIIKSPYFMFGLTLHRIRDTRSRC